MGGTRPTVQPSYKTIFQQNTKVLTIYISIIYKNSIYIVVFKKPSKSVRFCWTPLDGRWTLLDGKLMLCWTVGRLLDALDALLDANIAFMQTLMYL